MRDWGFAARLVRAVSGMCFTDGLVLTARGMCFTSGLVRAARGHENLRHRRTLPWRDAVATRALQGFFMASGRMGPMGWC